MWTCNKDNDLEPEGCYISDPINNLVWLDSIRNDLDGAFDRPVAEIIQYLYKDECVIYYDHCTTCLDKLVVVFDYEGEVICEFGSIVGLNTCPDFERLRRDSVLLYRM